MNNRKHDCCKKPKQKPLLGFRESRPSRKINLALKSEFNGRLEDIHISPRLCSLVAALRAGDVFRKSKIPAT